MELTISGKDMHKLKKLESLAKKMGFGVKRKIEQKDYFNPGASEGDDTGKPDVKPASFNTEKAISALKKLSGMNAFKDIEDPVAWQRQVRKDRKLFG